LCLEVSKHAAMKALTPLIFLFAMIQLNAQNTDTRSILVTGSHTMEVEPDEIMLNVTISEYYEEEFDQGTRYEDYKTRHPLDDIEKQFDQALKDAKIKDDQITVQNTGNGWRPWGKEALQSKQYQISLPDFDCVTKLQKLLRFKGVQSFQVGELKHSKKDELREEIRTQALINAREKAEKMAAALGQKIGAPITIVEVVSTYGYQPYRNMRSMEFASADNGGGNDNYGNNFKKLKIEEKVEVRFEILTVN